MTHAGLQFVGLCGLSPARPTLQIPRLPRAIADCERVTRLLHELDRHECADHSRDTHSDHQQIPLVLLVRLSLGGDRRRVGGRAALPRASGRQRCAGEDEAENDSGHRGEKQPIHGEDPQLR